MKPAQLLALAAFVTVRNLWGDTLKLDTIQKWIKENGNPNDYGRGYAGNRLSNGSGSAFVELHRENAGGGVQVSASVFMDARQNAFATKSWSAKKMDSKLEKMFGHNMRVRIDI